jgi:hypothetical protein
LEASFPLPPHPSHRDGRKVDLAAVPHGSPSWLGYFKHPRRAAVSVKAG